jgi:hypothetical protein
MSVLSTIDVWRRHPLPGGIHSLIASRTSAGNRVRQRLESNSAFPRPLTLIIERETPERGP